MVWQEHKRRTGWLPALYSTFLVVYLTLLRRAPGGETVLRWELTLGSGAWVGECLNLALYLPFGWAAAHRQNETDWLPLLWVVLLGLALSLVCEAAQYLTGRGWADINDVIFNTVGAALGALLWRVGKPDHNGKAGKHRW